VLGVYLSDREKEWFANAIVRLAGEDNAYDEAEQNYLVRYRLELGLEELDTEMSYEDALFSFAHFSTMNVRRAVFLELAIIAYSDKTLAAEEGKDLTSAAAMLQLENSQELEEIGKGMANLINRALAYYDEF